MQQEYGHIKINKMKKILLLLLAFISIESIGQVIHSGSAQNQNFNQKNITNLNKLVSDSATVTAGTFTTVTTSSLTSSGSNVNVSNKSLLNVNSLGINLTTLGSGQKLDVNGNAVFGQNNQARIYVGSGSSQIAFIQSSDSSSNKKHLRFVAKAINVYSDTTGDLDDTIPSAQLAVSSTTKGFLPPRMTTTQQNAITSPANGLVIHNLTTGLPMYYQSGWNTFGSNFFTDGGAYTYLTSTTDLFQVGSSSSNSSPYQFFI